MTNLITLLRGPKEQSLHLQEAYSIVSSLFPAVNINKICTSRSRKSYHRRSSSRVAAILAAPGTFSFHYALKIVFFLKNLFETSKLWILIGMFIHKYNNHRDFRLTFICNLIVQNTLQIIHWLGAQKRHKLYIIMQINPS